MSWTDLLFVYPFPGWGPCRIEKQEPCRMSHLRRAKFRSMELISSAANAKNSEARWAAVKTRNHDASGAFVYGVSTTRIFCRPNCRSRLPRRENVRFFDSPAEALQAGFRPCKRCQPNGPAWEQEVDSRISRACRLLEEKEGDVTLGALAKSAGFSPFYFHRLFKARLGITPRQYQQQHRLRQFKSRLRSSQTISTAIYDAGFGSATRAYAGIGTKLGMSPRQYRQGGAGTQISFSVKQTVFGWCLIAATNRGVCAIDFGGNPKELRQRLSSEFPQATLGEDPRSVAGHFDRLADYLANPGRGLSLPLDLKGTAFQCRVWQALREIPTGQTVSYTDLARSVGKPGAVRAVASACGANRVALAVPCHRALRGDGKLGGYRWGLERKRQLLHREKAANEN